MKALTLWRPWEQAILQGGKLIENRKWPLPTRYLGEPIALHAGKTYDKQGARWMADEGLYTPPADTKCQVGIVGVVVFDAVVGKGDDVDEPDFTLNDPWYFGPFGWRIKSARALERVVSCRGAQGLWDVPQDIVAQILEQDHTFAAILGN